MDSMNKNSFPVWELPQDAIARYGSGALCDLSVSADGRFLAVGTGGDDIRNCAIDKRGNSKCGRIHSGFGASSKPKCPFNSGSSKKYCARGGNSCPDGTESQNAKKCNRK